MPNKYKEGTVAVLVRMPGELKQRLEAVAKVGKISVTELARQAITDRVELLEKVYNIPSPTRKAKIIPKKVSTN